MSEQFLISIPNRIEPLRLAAAIFIAFACGDSDIHNQNNDFTGKKREDSPRWPQGIQLFNCLMPYMSFYGRFCMVQTAPNHTVYCATLPNYEW